MASHPGALEHAPGTGRRPYGARRPVAVRLTVGLWAACKPVALHHAGEPLALAGPYDSHNIPCLENPNINLIAHRSVCSLGGPDLHQVSQRRNPGLLQMPQLRLVQLLALFEADLNSRVPVLLCRLDLGHEAGPGLDDCNTDHPVPLFEKPGHTGFPTNDSLDHALLPS